MGRGDMRNYRSALRDACAELEKAQAERLAAERGRDAAMAQAERWRRELSEARRERDASTQRRFALVDSLGPAIGCALESARIAAWDEGWSAGEGGLPHLQNPYRAVERVVLRS